MLDDESTDAGDKPVGEVVARTHEDLGAVVDLPVESKGGGEHRLCFRVRTKQCPWDAVALVMIQLHCGLILYSVTSTFSRCAYQTQAKIHPGQ